MNASIHGDAQDRPVRRSFDTDGPGQTARVGRRLAAWLAPGDTVRVSGDLGAGKTCFIQGICAGLGVAEPVTSPTFTLVNEYYGQPGQLGQLGQPGRVPVAHFDLYRLDDPESVLDLGFDEYLDACVCLVEWGDKFPGIMPSDAVTVNIEIGAGTRRTLEIAGSGELVADLEAAAQAGR
ncbi:MAG: tRNA (adenosine(37)-N6)-threonylcarbamoyltransferase complex ATPase subunit type 1 TsaE [Gemmatimonadetes bacterium]|nr:tRNA (adenosine(37)-N6)-threonylcarbamoyltransferase complex ATPase subunit type 1 TsaE [Gemmatimonadota bacterium]